MKIRLGWDLDGQHGEPPLAQLDAVSVGPLGMLNLLETQLGLLRLETPQTERILQYRDCLKRLDNPERFYHRSFQVDELGTTAALLQWRDQWYLYGWPGVATVPPLASLNTAASRRLRDMADVEAIAVDTLLPGLGERLMACAQTMTTRKLRIHAVVLCDPLERWPQAWQNILKQLPLDLGVPQPIQGQAGTLLCELQTALMALNSGKSPEKIQWRDDGSVRLVQAETELFAARWLANEIAENVGADTLIVAPQGALLDEVLAASHQARQGFKEASAFRPALQVVPLALGQLWQPLDLYGLLEFLTHPICPVPGIARTRLAEMLANTPGIGHGSAWDETLAAIQAACEKSNYNWETARTRIRYWVENKRYDPQQGAPIAEIVDRLQTLAKYFRGRLKDADPNKQSAFASGQAQALACQRALSVLALQGETMIRPQQLQTLLQQATAQGAPNPLLVAEVGACRQVTQAGAVIDPAAQIIWWQLATPSMPTPWPWSLSEQAELTAAGVQLPDINRQLAQQADSWQQPILSAKDNLTLILPPAGNEVHPLWLLLESLFSKDHGPAIFDLENLLTAAALPIQPHRPLPEPKRWWQLPEEIKLPKRDTESYSSLESFLFNPYQWVLRYPAALTPSSLLSVSDGFLLYGNLAHHLVERYVQEPSALAHSDEDFQAWFETNFAALINDEGAVLLMPGRREEYETFRRKLRQSMRRLREHLKNADIVHIEPEVTLEGLFVGGKIAGYGDLLLTRRDGQQAIVDMKWSGGKKYPEKLMANRQLQLAIYGELLRQKTGNWPHLAYYLIESADLIATEQNFFPSARLIKKNPEVAEEGNAQLWQRFLKTWTWRRAQLDQGEIEVAIEVDESVQAPDAGLSLEILNQNYNNYLALAGWRETQ